MKRFLAIALVSALAVPIWGCAPPPPAVTPARPSTPSSQPASTPVGDLGAPAATSPASPQSPTALKVYFAYPEKMQPVARTVPHTTAVLRAALLQLLAGPTAAEKALGLSSQVPAGTRLRGVTVSANVAVVDFSSQFGSGGGTLSMSNRLAQVVYTCTQFPGVDAVRFKLDGTPIDALGGEGLIIDHPLTRADSEYSTPAILLDSPALGATVRSPVRLSGTSNVFEAAHLVQVFDAAGKLVFSGVAHATSGTGTRGTWSLVAKFAPTKAGRGRIRVFDDSAKDGKPENVVDVPVDLLK